MFYFLWLWIEKQKKTNEKKEGRGFEKLIFLLAGHKVEFISPCGASNSILLPSRRKKMCATWEKYNTRKIIFFSQLHNILLLYTLYLLKETIFISALEFFKYGYHCA